MKKKDLKDGCYYKVTLGFNGKGPRILRYVFTDGSDHIAIFEGYTRPIHITRVKYEVTQEAHPEEFL